MYSVPLFEGDVDAAHFLHFHGLTKTGTPIKHLCVRQTLTTKLLFKSENFTPSFTKKTNNDSLCSGDWYMSRK